ncbi:MAG: DUF2807 domain-containing protein [Bacteroidales bacterium]
MKKLFKISSLVISALFIFTTLVQAQTKTVDLTPASPDFDIQHIKIKGALTVVLMNGQSSKVWLEYEGDNTDKAEDIQLDYDDRAGLLKLDHQMKQGMPGVIFVQSPNIRRVETNIAVDLRSKDTLYGERLVIESAGASDIDLVINVESLRTNLSGASSVQYSGVAKKHYIKSSGAVEIQARRLFTQDLAVDISGMSDIDVLVSNSITGKLSGMSDLTNHTEARINDVKTSGTSSVGSNGDTTQFRFGKARIIIVDDDLKTSLDDDEEPEEKEDPEFDGHWGGFEMGVNGFVNADNKMELPDEYDFLELKMEKSILVNINLFEKNINLIREHVGLVTGLGLQYNNYRFANNVFLNNDSSLLTGYYDDFTQQRQYIKSKLVVNYITVPLILEYTTHGDNEFHIGAGAQFAYKIGEHTKNVYEDGLDKEKVKDRGKYFLNPYKLELTGRIGWGFVNLFATYSLNPMFEKDKGPEMYPFTAGITLIGW